MTAEATVTDRCGLTQFIAREGGKLHVLLNAGESLALTGGGSVSFTSSAQAEGFAVAGGFCGEANRQTVYFAADISRPPEASGTWAGERVLDARRLSAPDSGYSVDNVPPVVPAAAPEAAVFTLNWLSATGTGILAAALLTALLLGYGPRELGRTWLGALVRARHSLLTIALMLAIGYLSRYAGLDAILGLAFARTGLLYPFFGTLLGWLGVALTGSDTSSNVLFGSLQKISAGQLGISPVLMASANSAGGVMGKMIDAQSIVVASTATRWYGHEGAILRYVFFHSLVLAALMGLFVLLQAYVFPFTKLVVR